MKILITGGAGVNATGEAEVLIGESDLDLEYDVNDIIKSTNKWYKKVKVFGRRALSL